VFTFIRAMLYNLISEKIARNLRGDLYASLINKDVEFFDSKKTGDLCKLVWYSLQYSHAVAHFII
jgi:ABC-type bacteriocin/lantibiotic exporter with double-glycine peptidase domain